MLSLRSLLPWLGALAILLAAWILPLPGLVLSEDQFAAERTPQLRTGVEAASGEFVKAQERYEAYIKSHDVGAVRALAETRAREARGDSNNPERLFAIRDAVLPVREYALQLGEYAAAGENYFKKLREYDENLMGWTRSLGSGLERLRNETWPFVEYLKRYPLPVGEKADPPMVSAAEVFSQSANLDGHITVLNPNPNPHTEGLSREQIIDAILEDIAAIWSSGHSVENLGSLHDEYRTLLQAYDMKVQAAATGQGSVQPTSRVYLATALNILVGGFVLAGVAGLLMPSAIKSRLARSKGG